MEDHLFRDLKQQATERGTTLRSLVNNLLRRALEHPGPQQSNYRFDWKVDPKGAIQPGVRLNDRESLFDLMDGR
ncbi:MAG TPA: hypothetical protein VFZ08_02145 [Terriglobia bacterium]|nr:hypothetical protein [Terriglobia bacterium]